MVNEVLQAYMRAIHRRMGHLPGPMRRRVVSEVVAHIVLEAANLQRREPGLSAEEATRRAIEGFCPPEELLVAYGPEGGVVRRSTGTVVLRSRVLTVYGGRSRTFLLNGAAAAGLLAVVAVLAVVAFAFLPPGEDLSTQEYEWPALERSLADASGTEAIRWHLDRPAGLVFEADGTGCVGLRITSADGTVLVDALDECITTGSWTVEAGDVLVEARYTDWTGSWSLQAGPLP